MKSGTPTTIEVEGKTLPATYLGKGHYAKAYQVGDLVYLFVTGCYMKEAIRDIKHKHVPDVQYVDEFDAPRNPNETVYVYTMPYYRKISPVHKKAWRIFKELKRANDAAYHEVIREQRAKNPNIDSWVLGSEICYRTIEIADVPQEVKDALEQMAEACMNYAGSSAMFEFSQRNIGVDENGDIIFRDILFDWQKLVMQRLGKWK